MLRYISSVLLYAILTRVQYLRKNIILNILVVYIEDLFQGEIIQSE